MSESGFLVRWCGSRERARALLQALAHAEPDLERLVARVFAASGRGVSVYYCPNSEPVSLEHGLAVIAVTIASRDFDTDRAVSKVAKAVRKRKGASLFCCRRHMSESFEVERTPDGCLNFAPAREFHRDIVSSEGVNDVLIDVLSKTCPEMVVVGPGEDTHPFSALVKLVGDHCDTLEEDQWVEVSCGMPVHEQRPRLRRMRQAID